MITIKNTDTLETNLEKIRAELNETYALLPNGSAGNDLGFLCSSKKINIRAKNKPINSTTYEKVIDSYRKTLNYGHNIKSYNNISEMMEEVVSSTAFAYQRPQGGDYLFRLYDFNGYNHQAKDWLDIQAQVQITQDGILDFNVMGNEALSYGFNALTDLFSWQFLNGYSPSDGYINFGFIISSNAKFTESNFYYMPITGALTISDIVGNEKCTYDLNSQLSVGTYYFYPVFTTFNSSIDQSIQYISGDQMSYLWWPLPFANSFAVKVVSSTTPPAALDLYEISIVSSQLEEVQPYFYNLSNIILSVKSNNDLTQELSFYPELDSSNIVQGDVSMRRVDAFIDSHSTTNVNLLDDKTIRFEVAFAEEILLNVKYSLFGDNKFKTIKLKLLDNEK